MPVRQKSNASEGCNSALKCENVMSKVIGLKKQDRKHRSDSKPSDVEMPAELLEANSRTKGSPQAAGSKQR